MSNIFKSYPVKNISTTSSTVYTVPSIIASIGVGLVIANTTSSAITTNVYISRTGTNYYIVSGAVVPSGGSLTVAGADQKLILQTGDSVIVSASAGNSADCWFSLLEMS
jgi:hypothetical protein